MAAFGLDDVRESFTSDVTRFLGEVESNANLVAAAALAFAAERTCQPPVHAMVVGLHGIVGSSSLIALDSMTGTARRLEAIAASAGASIEMLSWHASRLQRIAAVCLEGAEELRQILEHELAGRTHEAQKSSAALEARLDRAAAGLDARQPTPAPAGVATSVPSARTTGAIPAIKSQPIPTIPLPRIPPLAAPGASPPADASDLGWDEAAAPSPNAPGGDASELIDAFREEARATLLSLRGHRARLEADPQDRDAARHCARLLHLLGGAAALVGRSAVAERAVALHGLLEPQNPGALAREVLAQLASGLDDLARALGDLSPPASLASPAPAPPHTPPGPTEDHDEEARQILLEEARRAIDQLRPIARDIAATAGTARGVAAARAERLLHRLKGSALIVGDPALTGVAARGQALCDELDRIDPAALAALVDELAALVAPPGAARALAGNGSPAAARCELPPAELWDAYIEESSALLDDLDRALARLEQSARPADELSAMFRAYHTLKGASSSVGLAPIARQLHQIESFLEQAHAAPALPDLRRLVTALAGEHAAIRNNLARAPSTGGIDVDHAATAARLAAVGEHGAMSTTSWISATDPVWSTPADEPLGAALTPAHTPPSHASHNGGEPSTRRGELPAPDAETAAPERRFVRVAADRLDGLLDLVGELVIARSRMLTRIGRIHRVHDDDQQRHGALVRLVDDFATATEFADLDGRRVRTTGRPAAAAVQAGGAVFGALELDRYEDIHVLSRQLDEAASDLAEMRRTATAELHDLTEDADALSAIVAGLQTEITQARMLTVETLFTRLQLPIRDAAQRVGRAVEIVTRGEQVAIDKSISDALFGPLLHIVRNAVVHGIESPGQRAAQGKPRTGTLTLAAREDQGQIILEISDDGQGIDLGRLKEIGVARGLIDPDTAETDPRVVELVFVHGLSTSGEVGDVAGRGVGGSVIRRAVDRLNGTIEVDTARGTGTTFRIALPLSVSITQAVMVRAAGVALAIPIAFAESIVPRDEVAAVESFGRSRIRIGDAMTSVYDTRRMFGAEVAPHGGALIVCAVGSERIALQVDEVIGQEEIVVKSLGSLLDGHPLFSGSTQRGDGELVLILDVPGVLEAEISETRGPSAPHARPAPIDEPGEPGEPARRETVPAAPSAAPPPAGPAPAASDRTRVLFVDDSLSVRKVAERMLRSIGVDVVTAVDGQDALDKLRETPFSLVFTDLEMPRVHGFELIREMRYLPACSATPVVVISSRSSQKHIDQAIELGAREYLTKPFSPESLSAALRRLVKPEARVS